MSTIAVVIISLALAMDAFAVAISSGVTINKMRLHHALRIAAFFGVFQAVMPIAGWSLGQFASEMIRAYDHWIALLLLSIVGGKMIYEAIHTDDQDVTECSNPLNVYVLLTLAFATSIDAAAVGMTMSFIGVKIIQPAIIIGCITFFLSLAGTYIGKACGDLFGKKIEIAGGVVLIGIGIKIAIEHLFFS